MRRLLVSQADMAVSIMIGFVLGAALTLSGALPA
jgi:hypothetical protein